MKVQNIPTVYYAPLAVNTDRLDRMFNAQNSNSKSNPYTSEISFVGSMYNEKHNLFDRFTNLSDYTRGYLNGIMNAQLKVYGYYFIEELLNKDIITDLQKSVPVAPNKDGVETVEYLYAYYFIARKLANLERTDLLDAVSKKYSTRLYTPNATPELSHVNNMGPIDYYNDMPYVFHQSCINLNITLRSIRSGIPLRCMDILGSGGFLLSNYQADFYDYFIPGEDLVLFDSKENLLAQCEYYLKHDALRNQIAANGYGKVKEHHTYKIRLKEILETVFSL
jgi:spore maturation protein CgeB